jgi:hypothetical protein
MPDASWLCTTRLTRDLLSGCEDNTAIKRTAMMRDHEAVRRC